MMSTATSRQRHCVKSKGNIYTKDKNKRIVLDGGLAEDLDPDKSVAEAPRGTGWAEIWTFPVKKKPPVTGNGQWDPPRAVLNGKVSHPQTQTFGREKGYPMAQPREKF